MVTSVGTPSLYLHFLKILTEVFTMEVFKHLSVLMPWCWALFWSPEERSVRHVVCTPWESQSVVFVLFTSRISMSNRGSQNTQKWVGPGDGGRSETSDLLHWAVIWPLIDSELSVAEMLIFVQPAFKSTVKFREWLPWIQVPHSLKSLSFSVATIWKNNNKKDRRTCDHFLTGIYSLV